MAEHTEQASSEEVTAQEGNAPAAPEAPPESREAAALRALIDREAAVFQKEQESKKSQAELELARLLRDNPAEALRRAGHDPSSLVPKEPEKPSWEDEVGQLRQQLTTLQQQRKEEEVQRAWAAYGEQVQSLAGSDEFPLSKVAGGGRLAAELAAAHYRETGELLSERDVVQRVESHLSDLAKTLASVSNGAGAGSPPPDQPVSLTTRVTSEAASRTNQKTESDSEVMANMLRIYTGG